MGSFADYYLGNIIGLPERFPRLIRTREIWTGAYELHSQLYVKIFFLYSFIYIYICGIIWHRKENTSSRWNRPQSYVNVFSFWDTHNIRIVSNILSSFNRRNTLIYFTGRIYLKRDKFIDHYQHICQVSFFIAVDKLLRDINLIMHEAHKL